MLNWDKDILIHITGMDQIRQNLYSCYVQNIVKTLRNLSVFIEKPLQLRKEAVLLLGRKVIYTVHNTCISVRTCVCRLITI